MSSMQIEQVLSQMRALQARATGMPTAVESAGATGPGGLQQTSTVADFGALMKSSMDQVAGLQNHAESMASAYEAGDSSVDLTKVMLEVQKAGLAFHAMTEVRNKLLDAYTSVMQMSV